MFRLRANASTREFEIEGSSDFIEKYWPELKGLLSSPVAPEVSEVSEVSEPSVPAVQPVAAKQSSTDELPGTFGEFLSSFGDLNGTQQALVAGFYYQKKLSEDNYFSTGDVDRLLKDQAIKLSNPSRSIRLNLEAKRVFKDGNRYRLTQDGEKEVKSLLES